MGTTQLSGHEQGQGQGEQRLVWGQASEGNAAAATVETAAAGQRREREHQRLHDLPLLPPAFYFSFYFILISCIYIILIKRNCGFH